MKKIFSLTLFLVMLLAACGTKGGSPAQSSSDTDPATESCPARFKFGSIEDFNTLLTTRSDKAEDYSTAPYPRIPSDLVDRLIQFYHPLETIVDFDTEQYGKLNIFSFQECDGWINFCYNFDTFSFSVSVPTLPNPVAADETINSRTGADFQTWKADKEYSDGYVIRNIDDCRVVYTKKDNCLDEIAFASDNYYIGMYIHENPAGMTTAEAAEEFFTSPATAGFAAFFSDDDAVFRAAVDRINAGLAGR